MSKLLLMSCALATLSIASFAHAESVGFCEQLQHSEFEECQAEYSGCLSSGATSSTCSQARTNCVAQSQRDYQACVSGCESKGACNGGMGVGMAAGLPAARMLTVRLPQLKALE